MGLELGEVVIMIKSAAIRNFGNSQYWKRRWFGEGVKTMVWGDVVELGTFLLKKNIMSLAKSQTLQKFT